MISVTDKYYLKTKTVIMHMQYGLTLHYISNKYYLYINK